MPKELPHLELVKWGWVPGNYTGRCQDCGDPWWEGDKRARRCERCAMIARYTSAEAKLAALDYLTA